VPVVGQVHEPRWVPGPATPPALDGDAHVWLALGVDARTEAALVDGLQPAEAEIAARLAPEAAARAYVLRHGILRHLLGRYLERDPTAIELAWGPRERPTVVDAPISCTSWVRDDHAICAFARHAHIGCALERVAAIPADELAAAFFTPREQETYDLLPATARLRYFYRVWAVKEALYCALAPGWAVQSEHVVAGTLPTQEEAGASNWTVAEVTVGDEYFAAVALRPPPARIRTWTWTPPV
jgi:4'-phosphopantetheinyl transferase